MAQTLLASGPVDRAGSDDYQVVVHVDAADLAYDDPDGGGDYLCQLDQRPALHPETARRLACDASVVPHPRA
jgi:hypothetical protein